jgi:hypothetical protein
MSKDTLKLIVSLIVQGKAKVEMVGGKLMVTSKL